MFEYMHEKKLDSYTFCTGNECVLNLTYMKNSLLLNKEISKYQTLVITISEKTPFTCRLALA